MAEDKQPEPPVSSFQVGINHVQRAREGAKLLKEGRPLSEMKTEVIGSSDKRVLGDRLEYIAHIQGLTEEKLAEHRAHLMKQLERGLNRELKGHSEYEWRRIQLEEEEKRRNTPKT